MTEAERMRHGLEPFLDSASARDATGAGITIQIQSGLAHVNLRGDAQDSRFVAAVEKLLGQQLPTAPNTSGVGDHRVYWLGPDEWLIVTEVEGLAGTLQETLAGIDAAVNDVSGGQLALRVSGPNVADVFAKGCTLDLHPKVFTAGMCAQSGLAKATVLIGLIEQDDQESVFDIVVRRSFSDYLVRWLEHAGREFDTIFSAS